MSRRPSTRPRVVLAARGARRRRLSLPLVLARGEAQALLEGADAALQALYALLRERLALLRERLALLRERLGLPQPSGGRLGPRGLRVAGAAQLFLRLALGPLTLELGLERGAFRVGVSR